MRRFDLSPFHSSTIGFDRIFALLGEQLPSEASTAYPPYNIERISENGYRITLAVAGFSEADLSLETRENTLSIRASKSNPDKLSDSEDATSEFLFRGIAARAFERRFQLADYVSVREAVLENGLLHIDLVREVPEAAKPKRIAIQAVRSPVIAPKAGLPEALAA